jgi:hypothetical protein
MGVAMPDFKRTENLQWLKKFDAIAGEDWDCMNFDVLNKLWKTLDRFRKHRIKCWALDHFYIDIDDYTHDTLYRIWEQSSDKRNNIIALWRRIFYSLSETNRTWVLEFIGQSSNVV